MLSTHKRAVPASSDPTTGGRYKRQPGGALVQVHTTQPVDGRVAESRTALAQRSAAAPAQPASAPTAPHNKE